MVGSLKKDNAAPGLEMLKRTKIKRTKIAQLSRLNCAGFNHKIKINTCCNKTEYVELHQLVSYLKTCTKTTEFSLITYTTRSSHKKSPKKIETNFKDTSDD